MKCLHKAHCTSHTHIFTFGLHKAQPWTQAHCAVTLPSLKTIVSCKMPGGYCTARSFYNYLRFFIYHHVVCCLVWNKDYKLYNGVICAPFGFILYPLHPPSPSSSFCSVWKITLHENNIYIQFQPMYMYVFLHQLHISSCVYTCLHK